MKPPKMVVDAMPKYCLVDRLFLELAPVLIIEQIREEFWKIQGNNIGDVGSAGPLPLERIKFIIAVHIIFPAIVQFYAVKGGKLVSLFGVTCVGYCDTVLVSCCHCFCFFPLTLCVSTTLFCRTLTTMSSRPTFQLTGRG